MDPAAVQYHIGDRVSVPTFGNGIVRFFGPTQFQPGDWVGVQLDVPGTGKNDGSVKGVRYFTCDANCGVFVRPAQVAPLQRTSPATNVTVEKPPLPAETQKPPPPPVSGNIITIPSSPTPAPAPSPQTPSPSAVPPPLPASSPVLPLAAATPTPNPNPNPPAAPAVSTPATPQPAPASAPVPTAAASTFSPSSATSPPQRGPLVPPPANAQAGSRPLSPQATVSHLPPEVERRAAQQQRVQSELQERTRVMFNQVGDYVKAELAVTLEDYKMLEAMNAISKDKYAEMTQITEGLRGQMAQLDNSYKELEPFLAKISDIESGISELEKAVTALNAYAKRLEEKLRMPDKSALAAGQPVPAAVKTSPGVGK